MDDEFSRGRPNGARGEPPRASDAPGSNHNAAEVHHAGWHELNKQARSPHPLEAAQRGATFAGANLDPSRERELLLAERAQSVLFELLVRGLEREVEHERGRDRREAPQDRSQSHPARSEKKEEGAKGRGRRDEEEESEPSKNSKGPRPSEDSERSEDSEKSEDSEDSEDSETSKDAKKKPAISKERKRLFIVVAVVAVLLLAIGVTIWWLHARHFENTDDAFIDANQSQVGSQIAGRVEAILVADNQHVDAGQPLLTLDPRDEDAKLAQARATAGNALAEAQEARAELILQSANIAEQQAQVKVAQAELTQARRDLARYQAIDPAAVTRQERDQAEAAEKSDAAKLTAAQQAVAGARAQAESQQAKIAAADAEAKEAQSQVQTAELQLSYTHIVAPAAGRVTKRTVNLGNFVEPGQALLAVVPDQMWVTANFKETQLTYMRAGQPVEIKVDAFSSQTIKGHVDSIQRGTGAVFSSIPAENATGNYVKVVQRVPVKIVFDGDDWKKLPLAPGMSVSPRVTVR